ncbi:hypothetical protein [Streptomyces sp. NPDC056061]
MAGPGTAAGTYSYKAPEMCASAAVGPAKVFSTRPACAPEFAGSEP